MYENRKKIERSHKNRMPLLQQRHPSERKKWQEICTPRWNRNQRWILVPVFPRIPSFDFSRRVIRACLPGFDAAKSIAA